MVGFDHIATAHSIRRALNETIIKIPVHIR